MKTFAPDRQRDLIKFSLESGCDTIQFKAGSISKAIQITGRKIESINRDFDKFLAEIDEYKKSIGQHFYTVLIEGTAGFHVETQCIFTIFSENAFTGPSSFANALRGSEDITQYIGDLDRKGLK